MRANFVGRSSVSAMTHTPASRPFALVTVPPRSVGPTLTPPPGCAPSLCCPASRRTPRPAAATTPIEKIHLACISLLLPCDWPWEWPPRVFLHRCWAQDTRRRELAAGNLHEPSH